MADETTTTAPAATDAPATPAPKGGKKTKTAAAKVAAKKAAAVKKAAAKKAASKAPKSKPMPNGKSVHAAEPKREPKWNARRIAYVKALRQLGATGEQTARTAAEIGKKMGTVEGVKMADRLDLVKIIGDVYRTAELVHNGFVKTVRLPGERELRYYLTAKGQGTTFPTE